MICAGTAGEAAVYNPSSCTFRSNICDDAGELIRGDDEWMLRPGEDGTVKGWPGDEVAFCTAGNCTGDGGTATLAAPLEVTPSFLRGFASSFFFPNAQNFLLLDFESCSEFSMVLGGLLPSTDVAAEGCNVSASPSPGKGIDDALEPDSLTFPPSISLWTAAISCVRRAEDCSSPGHAVLLKFMS